MQGQSSQDSFQCKQCDTVCPTWPDMLEHVESHYLQDEDRRFKCDQCGRGYRHAGSLVNHKKTHEVGLFHCPICGRQLTNPLALKNHVRIHTQGKSFQCQVCGKAFRLAAQLATHQRCHTERTHHCTVCGRSFRSQSQLAVHISELHANDSAANELNMSGSLGADSSDSSENLPLRPRNASNMLSTDGSEAPHKNAVVSNAGNHSDSHLLPDATGIVYGANEASDSSSLEGDRVAHNGLPSFSCSDCGKLFGDISSLKRHFCFQPPNHKTSTPLRDGLIKNRRGNDSKPVSEDTDDRPFKCNQCEKTYRHHGSLINHKKSHQLGAFECRICFKQFNNLAALSSHLRIHPKSTSNRSLQPPYFEHSDIPQDLLVSHAGSSISDTEKSNFCHLCEVAFADESEFQDHVMLHNNISLPLDHLDGFTEGGDLSHDYASTQNPELTADSYQPSSNTEPFESEGHSEAQEVVNGLAFTCACCGESYPEPNSLKEHYLTHGTAVQNEDGDKNSPHKAFQPSCSENTPSEEIVIKASLLHGSEESTRRSNAQHDSMDGERRFRCQQCGKSYRHAGSLINHKRSHQTGIYQCSVCGKQYPNLAALKSHLRIHKSKPLPQILDRTGSLNSSYWLSNEPMDNSESGTPEALYSCHICYQTYSTEALWKQHLVSHINGVIMVPHHDLQEATELLVSQDANLDAETAGESSHLENEMGSLHAEHAQIELDNQQQISSHFQAERHMCADCGETYGDIAGIKSHRCLLQKQGLDALIFQNGVDNFHPRNDYQQLRENLPLENSSSGLKGSKRRKSGPAQKHVELPDHKEVTDISEICQCSVCGNHYATLSALKSHLRSHTHTDADHPSHSMDESSLRICSVCGESFSNETDFHQHRLTHHEETSTNLQLEPTDTEEIPEAKNEIFINEPLELKTLKDENSEVETSLENKDQICGECGLSFKTFIELDSHQCGQGEVPVSNGPVFQNLSIPDNQEKEESLDGGNDEERPYQCDQCGRAYRHAGSLLNHKKSHKTGVFRCFVCQKRFYNLLALKNHQRVHFDVKRHKCTDCGKAFKLQKQLMSHQRIHLEKQIRAKQVNFHLHQLMHSVSVNQNSSAVQYDLKQPEINGPSYPIDTGAMGNKATGEETQETASHNPDIKGVKQLLICNSCGEMYQPEDQHLCQSKVTGHLNSESLEIEPGGLPPSKAEVKTEQVTAEAEDVQFSAVADDQRPYCCDQCGRTYRHAGSLVNHKKSHKTGHFYCTICHNTYPNQLAMKNHLRIHFAVKRYKCLDCGKAFRGQKQLFIHYQAHACGRTYKKGHLKSHLGSIRKGLGNASSVQNGHLSKGNVDTTATDHLDIKGEVPCGHSCEVCKQSFSTEQELAEHTCDGSAVSFDDSSAQSPEKEKTGPDQISSSKVPFETEDRPFRCDICSRTYRHAGSLLNHKNTHKTGRFECYICQKMFSNPMALKNHLRIHSQKKRHHCLDCGKSFRLSSALRNHQKLHLGELSHRCKNCGKGFISKSSLRHHHCRNGKQRSAQSQNGEIMNFQESHNTSTKSPNDSEDSSEVKVSRNQISSSQGEVDVGQQESDDRPFRCDQCGRTYRHAGSLLNHKNTHTTGTYHCTVCQKEFSNLLALKNHHRIHSEVKRYKCLDCGKAFRVSSHLISHRRVHTKERPYYCVLCCRGFASKATYCHHQTLHKTKPLYFLKINKRNRSRLILPLLGSQLTKNNCSEDSQDEGNSVEGEAGQLRTTIYRCELCKSFHPTLEALHEHQETHVEEKIYACEHCGKTYRHAGSLLNHKNSHKTGLFSCSACQKQFSNLMALKNHRRIHTEPKRYQCMDCGKAFRVSTQLICHRRVHTKEKPFSCSHCSRCFSTKSNLRHHQKVHRGSQGSHAVAEDLKTLETTSSPSAVMEQETDLLGN
ncbi:zinc finger protein 91 [Polypterus senegalus]|nr:zinc finger protein 91 [Polypterus senegalus]